MKDNVRRRMQLTRIQDVFVMHELGKSNREIARELKVSASTVSETLNKYQHPRWRTWRGMNVSEKARYVYEAQKAAARGKKRFRGHVPDVKKRDYIVECLTERGWSPEIIASSMYEEIVKTVSVNTIYRYVKVHGRELRQYLHEQGKPRKQRVANRRGRFARKGQPEKSYIDQRPEAVQTRKEFGHWEGDLVVGPKAGSSKVVLGLLERKARKKQFILLPDRKAKTVLGYLVAFFLSLPPGARLSLTLDNGPEFAVSEILKLQDRFPGLKIYYTETYSPEQKGSIEHANGRFRKTFPKKTDFADVSKEQIARETHRQNTRPMKLHGFKTPQYMYEQELLVLQAQSRQAA